MKTIDGDIEEMAAESAQDRKDHAKLEADLQELLHHGDAMTVPWAVRHLVDSGIDPVVVAKTLLICDRAGGMLYELSSRAPALGADENKAEAFIAIAIRDCEPEAAVSMMVAGAVWLAMQFKIELPMLRALVNAAPRRIRQLHRYGYGAVDLVDHHGVNDRAFVADALDHVQLPLYAPLEYKP